MSSLWTNASSDRGRADGREVAGPETSRSGSGRGRPRRTIQRVLGGARSATAVEVLSVLVVVCAPLAVGAVHPQSIAVFASASAISLLVATARRPDAHLSWSLLAAPVVLTALPLLQLVPLPSGFQAWANHESYQLLLDVGAGASFRPWTLDFPGTVFELAKAAAGLAIFVVASQVASPSRRRRNLYVHAVAYAGVAALLVGIGHRIWSIPLVYGHFGGSRPFLNGPFVNPNHNAEFLELAAFAGLAASLGSRSRLQSIFWSGAAISCAAGAIATLSRGSLLALTVGILTFGVAMFLRTALPDPLGSPQAVRVPRSRRVLPWILAGVASLIVLALALGAIAVVERITREGLLRDTRLSLWRDSFNVLAAHPLGIGGGTFDRVYPVYRTFLTQRPVRFTHLENQPLQFLLEFGWVGFGAAVVTVLTMAWGLRVRAMGPSSIAIAAGLIAVLAHNLVDFGIDLLGISLPFAALLGTLAGRYRRPRPAADRRMSGIGIAVGVALLAIGSEAVAVPLILSARFKDFDAEIRGASTTGERRTLAVTAGMIHPVDYFYPLAEATASPLVPDASGRYAKLRTLNRALRLCPTCAEVHLEVARALWSLFRRKQALVEYRSASVLETDRFAGIVSEVWQNGHNPGDLETLAASDPKRLVDVCFYLLDVGAPAAALAMLQDPTAGDLPRVVIASIRGRAALLGNDLVGAEEFLTEAQKLSPGDSRISLYLSEALERNGQTDRSLQVLESALARFPGDVRAAQARLAILIRHQKWSMTEKAIEAFKQALQTAQMPTADAHIAAARIYQQQGRITDSLTEYQLASVQWPEDVNLLVEYAVAADRAGHIATAAHLLSEATNLNPTHQGAQALKQQIAARRREISSPPPPSFDQLQGGAR
jgi:Flp pilus assembly protein TadD